MKTPFLKKINPRASPGAKKNVAGCPDYRRPKKIAPAHGAALNRVEMASETHQKSAERILKKNNKKSLKHNICEGSKTCINWRGE